MKKLTAALAVTAALAIPASAGASVGGDVVACTGGATFGQVISGAQPGFNLGQHQKGALANGGGARGFVAAHCSTG